MNWKFESQKRTIAYGILIAVNAFAIAMAKVERPALYEADNVLVQSTRIVA